jgi:hypothetical protein
LLRAERVFERLASASSFKSMQVPMGKNQNTFEKRRREIEKKQKAEEKRKRREEIKKLPDEPSAPRPATAAELEGYF